MKYELKVAAETNTGKLAAAIAGMLEDEESQEVNIVGIGAAAAYNALKALIVAETMIHAHTGKAIKLLARFEFEERDIKGNPITVMCIKIRGEENAEEKERR